MRTPSAATRALNGQRKRLPQPVIDLGRGRRFDIGEGGCHGAGHGGLGLSAQHCRDHGHIAQGEG